MMSPMCQYSVWDHDGRPNAWHQTHYISRAVGGAGLIMMEMTDVLPDGRITIDDLGLWDDGQIGAYAAIIKEIHRYGAKAGIQIAHAGRKAESPELQPEAPSAIAFSERYRVPHALSTDEVRRLVESFRDGARRAVQAGVDTLELHGAHGYLINQFMSPLSNHRDDIYGDPTRFGVEVIQAVRSVLPTGMPLIIRLSAVEYSEDGYSFEELLNMARTFRDAGIDMFDISTGGNAPSRVAEHPGYQAPYAIELKRQLDVPVTAVGRLESFDLAASLVDNGLVDMVAVARGMLEDPYWANSAALHLGSQVQTPRQYNRAFPRWFTSGERP
jgi:2,4-dienoyl-CoA reductase-like NADH-dependent reductase (Old Yellow Enzyme family)